MFSVPPCESFFRSISPCELTTLLIHGAGFAHRRPHPAGTEDRVPSVAPTSMALRNSLNIKTGGDDLFERRVHALLFNLVSLGQLESGSDGCSPRLCARCREAGGKAEDLQGTNPVPLRQCLKPIRRNAPPGLPPSSSWWGRLAKSTRPKGHGTMPRRQSPIAQPVSVILAMRGKDMRDLEWTLRNARSK